MKHSAPLLCPICQERHPMLCRCSLPPVARATDPETSRQSAAEMDADGTRTTHLLALVEVVREHPDKTLRELANASYLDAAEVSKRLSDLSAVGAIRESGRRRCSVSGRPARTWRVR